MAEVRQTAIEARPGISDSAAKVLRNTYALLAMTLAFSAFTGGLAMVSGIQSLNPIVFLVGAYGLLFLTHFTANSAWGLLSVFAFTGFMGFAIGPISERTQVSSSLRSGSDGFSPPMSVT